MKKIFLFISLIILATVSKAQFPSTDSLQAYNNKYVKSSPLSAFEQLRMNTLLRGMISWIDSARLGTTGSVGMDTLYTLNDSTVRYKKNGVFYNKTIKGIYDTRRKLDTLYTLNDSMLRFTINGQVRDLIIHGVGGSNSPPADGSETKLTQGSNITISGTGTTGDPYLISGQGGGGGDSSFITISIAGLNAISSPQTTKPYYVTDAGKEGFFYYSGTVGSQASENMATVVVTSDLKQFKRSYDGTLNLLWFPGATADYVYQGDTMAGTDNTSALNAMYAAATDNQPMIIPNTGTGWLFSSTPTSWTNTKTMNLTVYGNTYHKGQTFLKAAASSNKNHKFIHEGNMIGMGNLPTHSKTTYDNQTGIDAATGKNWELMTGYAIDCEDNYKADFKVNYISGFAAAIRINGNANAQEHRVEFKFLDKNRVGILLESLDGSSTVDKNYFVGGRISGDTAIKVNGNVTGGTPTGVFKGNVFQNVLIEGVNTGVHVTGEFAYNSFNGCKIELSSTIGVYGSTKLFLDNTAGRVYNNSFIGFSGLTASDLANIGKNTSFSSTPIFADNGSPVGSLGLGGYITGRFTMLGAEGLSSQTRSGLPSNIDLITLGGGISGEPRSTIFAYSKINGIERRVGYKGNYANFTISNTGDTLDLPVNVGYVKVSSDENKSLRIDTGDIQNAETFYFDYVTPGFTVQFLNKNTNAVLIPSTSFAAGAGLYKATYTEVGYRVFKLDGSSIGTDKLQALSLKDFGGIEGSSLTSSRTENVNAWNSMLAASVSGQLCIVPGGNWYFNDTLIANSTTKRFNIWVIGRTYFTNGGYEIEGAYHRFKADAEILGGGVNANDSLTYSQYIGNGVYLKNADKCKVEVNRITGFHTGIKLAGESYTTPKGTQYCDVKYSQIRSNYIQIHVSTVGATTGTPPPAGSDKGNWSNSNIFHGEAGQLGGGTNGPAGGTFGVVIKKDANSNQWGGSPFNYNYFFHTGFEGLQYGIYAENADFNYFIGARWELNAITNKIYLSEDTTDGKECYGNSLSNMTLYESFFMPNGKGYSTSLTGGKMLTVSGVVSGDLTFYSGTKGKFLNLAADETATAFSETVNDLIAFGGFPGNGNYRYGMRVKRIGWVDAHVPLELGTITATANYTVGNDIQTVLVNPTSTATITLPSPTSWPRRRITIKSLQTYNPDIAATVFVGGSVRGNDPIVIPGGASVTYEAVGTEWVAIASHSTDLVSGGGTGGGGGDVSSNTTTSVDNTLALFTGTTGKLIKKSVGNGLIRLTNGVITSGIQINLATEVSGLLAIANINATGTRNATTFLRGDGTWAVADGGGGTGGGIDATVAFGGTANSSGLTISGTTIQMNPASSTQPGGVSIGIQTFAGAKTYTGSLTLRSNTASSSTAPLYFGSGTYTLMSTPFQGAMEYDGTSLFITDNTNTRQTVLTNSNFASIINKTIAITSGGTGLTTLGAADAILVSTGTGLQYVNYSSQTDLKIAAATSMSLNDGAHILCCYSGLAGAITLPAPSSAWVNKEISIKNADPYKVAFFSDEVWINPSQTLSQLDAGKWVMLKCDGTKWWVIMNN